MSTELTHLDAQLQVEEGDKRLIYDDATGKPFRKGDTLKGNLSAGIGLNLMVPFDSQELAYLEQFRIAKGQALLAPYAWYASQDPVRQVALADIAYNVGVGGLLHWPNFLSAMGQHDYPAAVQQLQNDHLWLSQVHPLRARRIENMIASGDWPTDVKVEGVTA